MRSPNERSKSTDQEAEEDKIYTQRLMAQHPSSLKNGKDERSGAPES